MNFKYAEQNCMKFQITVLGMGISEHIRRMRVKVACDLLRNTEDRVSDIATEVGISDYNYFTKVFKKAIGVTPREYRKLMRKQT